MQGSSVYLVPRNDGELVLGATQEELGPDTTVTAGGVWQLLRDARAIVPGITELELAEAVAGLRPGTPDNAPVIGPSPLPGLVLATGHFRGRGPARAGDRRPGRRVPRDRNPGPGRGPLQRAALRTAGTEMEIVINGAPHQVADDMSLERAVSLVSQATTGIAAAVNGELVRRASWPSTRLATGDEVEVLTAVQGG